MRIVSDTLLRLYDQDQRIEIEEGYDGSDDLFEIRSMVGKGEIEGRIVISREMLFAIIDVVPGKFTAPSLLDND